MPKSIRPWVTVGVAIVGVGVISVTPVQPTPKTDVRVENAAVALNAAPSPFEYYPQIVERSLANAGDRLDEYFADPLPVVRAVAKNQYAAFADVVDAAAALDPAAFVHAVVKAITQPVTDLVRVAGSGEPFETANSLLIRLALPIVTGALAAGSAVADVVKAFADLDPVTAVSALMNVPGRIVDGVLNGRVDGHTDAYFGLLGPVVEAPVADQISGPVDFLIGSLQRIGDTISATPSTTATAMAGPAVSPDLSGTTVTLPAKPSGGPSTAAPGSATESEDAPPAPASGSGASGEDAAGPDDPGSGAATASEKPRPHDTDSTDDTAGTKAAPSEEPAAGPKDDPSDSGSTGGRTDTSSSSGGAGAAGGGADDSSG